jgi:hypothetical protein
MPAYIRLLSAELEYPGQFPASDVLVGYASAQFPQFPLTPPEADAFVSGELGIGRYERDALLLLQMSWGLTVVFALVLGSGTMCDLGAE